MPYRVMPEFDSYEAAREGFDWEFPEPYNPAADLLRKHDAPDRAAVVEAATGDAHSYADLDRRASRLAHALADLGVEPGDRVAVVAPQRPATVVAHAAVWLVGAVTVPLTTLFGRDAMAYRVDDAGARVALADPAVRDDLAAASRECPALETVVEFDAAPFYVGEREPSTAGDDEFDATVRTHGELVAGRPDHHEAHEGTVETPTAVMYTSGSTGPPKGVRHGHALWLGRAAAAYNFFDGGLGPEATTWTPADWAWGSALGGCLFGTLHYGGTVVAAPTTGFDPAAAFELLERFGVDRALIPPTALRMLASGEADPADHDLALRSVACAGEPLTPEVFEWVAEELPGCHVNEYYGQTELNLVVGNRASWFDPQPGSMGRVYPGYEVTVLDPETREELPAGEVGELAVKPDDERVFFTEYLGRPEATAAKRHGEWYLTDDLVRQDEDGHLWFESRADDVIITAGYRVGPPEVEQVLLDHPAVEQAGVVGVPDDTRGEVIKAFVALAPGHDGDDELRAALRERARDRLAEYEYPRDIEFVEELPMTASGKIRRVELREREVDDETGR